MTEAEIALQMAARHVAEQEARVREQEELIACLRRSAIPRSEFVPPTPDSSR
jgi:hypothetical protein